MLPCVAVTALLVARGASSQGTAQASLGLRAFVTQALANDVLFQASAISSGLAKAGLKAVLSGYKPTVMPVFSLFNATDGSRLETWGLITSWNTSLGVGLEVGSVRSQPENSLGTTSIPTREDYAQATVPIGAQFGRLPALVNIEQARNSYAAAQRSETDQRQSTILAAVEAYYSYLQAKRALKVAESSVEQATRSMEITSMKFELGDLSRVDLDRAKQSLQLAKISALSAKNSLSSIGFVIENRFGIKNLDAVLFTVQPAERFVLPYTIEQALDLATQRNPQLLQARDQIHLGELQVQLAKRELWPSLALNYRAGRLSDPLTGQMMLGIYHQWGLTSNLSLDFSQRELALKSAEAQLAIARLSLQQLDQQLRAQLAAQLDAFARQRELIDASTLSVETARAQVEVAELRFKKGLGSGFDLIQSQERLESAELDLIAAEVQFFDGYYSILYGLEALTLDSLIE